MKELFLKHAEETVFSVIVSIFYIAVLLLVVYLFGWVLALFIASIAVLVELALINYKLDKVVHKCKY